MWSSDDFYIVIFVAVIGLIFWDSISAFRKWRTSRRMDKAAGRAFSEFLSSSGAF